MAPIIEIGLNHEEQHQELLLTDIKHAFSFNPLYPVYRPAQDRGTLVPAPLKWLDFPEGVSWIGHEGDGFCFDNEQPRHRTFLEAFQLANRLVTNDEYMQFIEDGGYENPLLWLSDGWHWISEAGYKAPLYWLESDNGWEHFTLQGRIALQPNQPVTHISFFGADAFARWAGARLATEAEWEVAASTQSSTGNFVESGLFHPQPAQPRADGLLQAFGDTWEWTQSPYLGYPGYQPMEGALGEYNGKFMSGQMVLRGGSCVTSGEHIRTTYRNFFPPTARWQFSGIRIARDAR